jgi:hypothetical protein
MICFIADYFPCFFLFDLQRYILTNGLHFLSETRLQADSSQLSRDKIVSISHRVGDLLLREFYRYTI